LRAAEAPILVEPPFLDVFWTTLIFFAWVTWFALPFRVFGDIFRRRDIGGGSKMLWLVFVVALPFLGVFVNLIAQSEEMADRTLEREQATKALA
jgi:Phospholipase_D-nuclease N-terminal